MSCYICGNKAVKRMTPDLDIKGIELCDDKSCHQLLMLVLYTDNHNWTRLAVTGPSQTHEQQTNMEQEQDKSNEERGQLRQADVSRGPFKVEWREWHNKCADGCCDEYGIEVFVDGRSIGSKQFGDTGDAIEMLMEHLGHSVEVRRIFSHHC